MGICCSVGTPGILGPIGDLPQGKTESKGSAQLYVYLVSQQTFYSTCRLKTLLKIMHAIWTPRAML